jgi:hypothetical protein
MQTAAISTPLEQAAGITADAATVAEIEEVFTDVYIAPTSCLEMFDFCSDTAECCPPLKCTNNTGGKSFCA